MQTVYVIITGLGFIHVETMYVIYFLLVLPLAGRGCEPVVTGMMHLLCWLTNSREWTRQAWCVVVGPQQKHHVLLQLASPGSNVTNQIYQISSLFQSPGQIPVTAYASRYTQQKRNLVSGASPAAVPTWFLAPKACPELEFMFHWR